MKVKKREREREKGHGPQVYHEINTCRTSGEREHIACCLTVRCALLQVFSALAGPITPAPAICDSAPWIVPDVSLGSRPRYLQEHDVNMMNVTTAVGSNSPPATQLQANVQHTLDDNVM